MTSRNESPGEQAHTSSGAGNQQALSSGALARRRLLLKGIGKGGAVLVATVPLKTLATQNLLTYDGLHGCSISGAMSGVHSATPKSTPSCVGFTPNWWGQSSNGTSPLKTWPTLPGGYNYATSCRTIFTKSTLAGNPSLFQVMNSMAFANTDERHWVCAWLNALWDDQTMQNKFPYTGTEVLGFYGSASQTTYQNSLLFFKGFMETRTS